MSRPLRIEFAGATYHVTSRGNRRSPIFRNDCDRREFLELLADVRTRFGWEYYAYCLMGNHYHLAIRTPESNLARGMRFLNGVYTQRFNRRHGEVGHVFQGRYHAVVVQRDDYLLQLLRYIVLNPVRAGLTIEPSDWHWSSYQRTSSRHPHGSPPLAVDWILSQFPGDPSDTMNAYCEFVHDGIGQPRVSAWTDPSLGAVGTRAFHTQCSELAEHDQSRCDPEIPRLLRYIGRPSLLDLFAAPDALSKTDRNQRIAQAHVAFGYSMTEIARHLGLHTCTVSRAVQHHATDDAASVNDDMPRPVSMRECRT